MSVCASLRNSLHNLDMKMSKLTNWSVEVRHVSLWFQQSEHFSMKLFWLGLASQHQFLRDVCRLHAVSFKSERISLKQLFHCNENNILFWYWFRLSFQKIYFDSDRLVTLNYNGLGHGDITWNCWHETIVRLQFHFDMAWQDHFSKSFLYQILK